MVPEEIKPKFMFNDVNEMSSVYNDICSLINADIILGYDDGTFQESKNINQEEVLIMCVNILGFDNYSMVGHEKYGVYKSLIEGTKLSELFDNRYGEITRDMLTDILYEFLFTNVIKRDITTKGALKYSFGTQTVLSKFYEYSVKEGIVSANEFTSLTSSGGAVQKNGIQIEDVLIKFAEKDDINSYLGYYVSVIYDDNGDGKAIKLNLKKNSQFVIEANSIEKFDETTYTLSYEDENEKIKNIEIKNDVTLIFNDVVIEDLYDNAIFTPSNGKLVFIDNDRDGKYEILKIDAYATYIVESVTENGKILSDAMQLHDKIDLEKASYRITKNGEKIDYSNIGRYSVVMVAAPYVTYRTEQNIRYMTPDVTRSNFYKIVAMDKKISGAKNGGNNEEIKIAGETYEYSDELNIAISMGRIVVPNNGTTFEIGLDLNGDAAYLNTSAITVQGVTYAFLKRLVYDEDTESVAFKAFNENGAHISVSLPEKVYVYRMWSNGSVTVRNYYKKKIEAVKLVDKTTVPEFFDEGEFVPQLIKYSANSNGEIDTIYVAVDTFGNTIQSLIKEPVANKEIFTREFANKEMTDAWDGGDLMMYHWFRIAGGITTFFTIPADLSNERLYRISKNKKDSSDIYLNTVNPTQYDFSGYDADADSDLGVLVMREPQGIQASLTGTLIGNNNYIKSGIIVDSVNEVYDAELDEIKYQLEGYENSNKVSYYFKDPELLSNEVKYKDNETKQDVERVDVSRLPITELKRGDLIFAARDLENNITGFKVIWHDVEDKTAPGYMGTFIDGAPLGEYNQTSSSYCQSHSGTVTEVGIWGFYIKAYNNGYLRKALCNVDTDIYLLSGNGKRQSVQVINFSDIQPGDYVKTRQTYVNTFEVLVVRD